MDASEDLLSNKNIVRPHLVWSGQRCFRVIGDYNKSSNKRKMIEEKEVVEHTIERPPEHLEDGQSSKSSWKIVMIESGAYEARLSISSIYYGYICGTKHVKKTNLEKETSTRILLPKSERSNTVIVTGASARSVDSACARISMMLVEKRRKSGVTHFVSLPVNTEAIRTAFTEFKKAALAFRGVDEDLFQTPMKLHLTLGILTLLEPSEVELAKEVIHQFVSTEVRSITQGKPIKIKLKGLEIMCDDPTAVDVLYACVEEDEGSSMLQQIADKLNTVLEQSGHLSWNARNEGQSGVKLHATCMNSKFKKVKLENAGQQTYRKRYSFDATQILKHHGTFEFGLVVAEQFLFCVRGPEGADGAHQRISSHSFTN